jgi:hypothetical protein
MRNLQFTGKIYGETVTIQQIQKRTAKKLFNNGEIIYLQSSNFHPFGAWSTCYDCNKNNVNNNGETFDNIVNNFEYYNCANNETGLYTTFYKIIS